MASTSQNFELEQDAGSQRLDTLACAVALACHFIWMARADANGRILYGCLSALELLILTAPGWLRRRVRTPVMTLLRLGVVVVVPYKVDLLHILEPEPAAKKHAAAVLGGFASNLGSHTRALYMLFFSVCGLPALFGCPLGWQLPPALHAVLHSASILSLQKRNSAVCTQYLARHPSNGRIVGRLYWLLEHAASLSVPGMSGRLAAATKWHTDAHKCSAVVSSLQVCLGFVLPTLLAWQAQLAAARERSRQRHLRRLAARQQLQRSAETDTDRDADDAPGSNNSSSSTDSSFEVRAATEAAMAARAAHAADAELERSPTWRMCRRVLQTSQLCGWPLAVLMSAILSFTAAVLWQERALRLT